MIVHKYIPGLGIQKTGLEFTFSDVSEGSVKLSVTSGALTKNGVQSILAEADELTLTVPASIDNNFFVILGRLTAEPHSIAVCVVQSSPFTRRMPGLADHGYELVEVLGFGTISAGNASAADVDCTVNEWI